MNSTFNNTMGNNTIHDLTLLQLQQQAQQLIQQNTILAAQLQLTRSQSLYNQPAQQQVPTATTVNNIPSKPPAQRSLSDLYYPTSQQTLHQQQRSMPPTTPPGLCTSPTTTLQQQQQKPLHHQSASILAQLPQPPC